MPLLPYFILEFCIVEMNKISQIINYSNVNDNWNILFLKLSKLLVNI